MRKQPKIEEIKLPYSSSVASFYGDQGAVTGSSFLSKMFGSKGARAQMVNNGPAKVASPAAAAPTQWARGADK